MSRLDPLVAGFFAPLLALKVELKYLSKVKTLFSLLTLKVELLKAQF